jgi:hypothetical protein
MCIVARINAIAAMILVIVAVGPACGAADGIPPTDLVEAEDASTCTISGKHNVYAYPRSVGRKVVVLQEGAQLTFTTTSSAVSLRLPPIFLSPGPYYGNWLDARLRWRVDTGPWHELAQAAAADEVSIARGLFEGEHTIALEAVGGPCCVDAFRVSDGSYGSITGVIYAKQYSELLTDVRADLFQGDELVRTEYVRSPHSGGFLLGALPPATYRVRFTAAGWLPAERRGVKIARPGDASSVGAVTRRRWCRL